MTSTSLGSFVAALVITGSSLALLSTSSRHGRHVRASEALAAEPVVVAVKPGLASTNAASSVVVKARPSMPVDALGKPLTVPELAAPWLDDVALASLSPHSALIYVNPGRCTDMGPAVCAFFREHERGHVELRHAAPYYTAMFGGRETAEAEADCYAAKHAALVDVKAAIVFFLRPEYVNTERGAHGTGAERAERIRSCRGL